MVAKHKTTVHLQFEGVTTPRYYEGIHATRHTTTAHSTRWATLPAAAAHALPQVGFQTAHPVRIMPSRVAVVEALHSYYCAAAVAEDVFGHVTSGVWERFWGSRAGCGFQLQF